MLTVVAGDELDAFDRNRPTLDVDSKVDIGDWWEGDPTRGCARWRGAFAWTPNQMSQCVLAARRFRQLVGVRFSCEIRERVFRREVFG
jgi:hypothetical protein